MAGFASLRARLSSNVTRERLLAGVEFCGSSDSNGSASAGRVRDLNAGKLTTKLSDRIADVRGRQYTTRCCR